ncbi:MAG TPA: inosine/xanthosine triphosphatase [Candidatus Acidoferrum sp.]|nr:inosine/xanthosine triphosphatase [Candidatus Acidoferrum sp.]
MNSQANKILIVVGSTRKPKVGAVRDAVAAFGSLLAPEKTMEVIGVEVESGVSHTPTSREELMQGARQRAEAVAKLTAQNDQPGDFFVGLEGGLDVIHENGQRRVFLESWAYVSDGTKGFFGRSGSIEVAEAVAEEVVERDLELSVAIDRFAGEAGIRDAQGAWGVLSANLVTRQDSFRVAVITAFAPFYNAKMYGRTGAKTNSAAK